MKVKNRHHMWISSSSSSTSRACMWMPRLRWGKKFDTQMTNADEIINRFFWWLCPIVSLYIYPKLKIHYFPLFSLSLNLAYNNNFLNNTQVELMNENYRKKYITQWQCQRKCVGKFFLACMFICIFILIWMMKFSSFSERETKISFLWIFYESFSSHSFLEFSN